jgi:hypothetical protein
MGALRLLAGHQPKVQPTAIAFTVCHGRAKLFICRYAARRHLRPVHAHDA